MSGRLHRRGYRLKAGEQIRGLTETLVNRKPWRMPDPIDRLTAAPADRFRLEPEVGAGGMATVAANLPHPHFLPLFDASDPRWASLIKRIGLRIPELPGPDGVPRRDGGPREQPDGVGAVDNI